MIFKNKRILITGGTGSLGKKLIERILGFEQGRPTKIIIFSRDEAKQHQMRLKFKNKSVATDDIIYKQAEDLLDFVIGDIRNPDSVENVLREADIVINAAALKQVPTCEYFPLEAVKTNVLGASNIVNQIAKHALPVEVVVGVSTDKACKPVNVMGMTKSIQERVFIEANVRNKNTRYVCVRYGNVLISRGSVVPLFHQQIRSGGPVTITDPAMTRFLLSLDQAVDTVFAAIKKADRGETFIPKVKSAKIIDVANVLIGKKKIEKKVIGVRPGEKTHEILISEEERWRTLDKGDYYAIQSILPELRSVKTKLAKIKGEYSSADDLLSKKEIYALFKNNKLLVDDSLKVEMEG